MSVLPSLPSLLAFYSSIVTDLSYDNVVTPWLNQPSTDSTKAINYNAFAEFMASKCAFATNASLVVTLDDGTVMFDSVKGSDNTHANYKDKKINENHNTRPEIMNATLSASGTGFSRRYSSSSQVVKQYYAVRVGLSSQTNIATIRVSLTEV